MDSAMQSAERLMRGFDEKSTVERERVIRDINSISQEFFSTADNLREWAEEKENEMVERGEI